MGKEGKSKGKDSAPVDSYSHFDRIVVPGDLIDPDMEELAKWPVEEINLISPLLSVSRADLYPKRTCALNWESL